MKLIKIIVAVDFSESSGLALTQAIAVARRCQAQLTLLWVEGEGSKAPSGAAVYGTAVREIERLIEEARTEHLATLQDMAERARASGVETEVRAVPGSPAETIVAVAGELGADLVVTGTKGLTGFKRFFLGSVAAKVVRTSHTSVLVARGDTAAYGRILVATDFSSASESAIGMALAVAAPAAEITLFHAWQYPPGTMGLSTPDPTEGPLLALRDEIVGKNRIQAEAAMARHAHDGISLRFVQEHGAAAVKIQEMLEAESYDLVCMGTHGYRGLQRFLLGSVAEETVRHSPGSVLVVRGSDQGADAAG